MIEVLVAATILTVIVMMLGMLFQQTSLAWRTGVKRADAFMQVRSAIGSIQRDASAAVDARFLPQDLATEQQKFTGSSILFYTLTGTDGNRALTKVEYSIGGASCKRTVSVLSEAGKWMDGPSSDVLNFVSRAGAANKPKTTLGSLTAEFGDLPQNGLPLYVMLTADVISRGNAVDIGAASAGPDREWNTDDDIRTWTLK